MSSSLTRSLLAAAVALTGAISVVTFSAEAAPTDPDQTTLSAEAETSPEGKRGKRGKKGARRGGGGGANPTFLMMRAVGELDLSESQRGQIDGLKAERKSNMQQARSARSASDGADMFSGEIDRQDMHAQLDTRYSTRLAAAHGQLDHTIDVLEILTPQQRMELQEQMKTMRADRKTHTK